MKLEREHVVDELIGDVKTNKFKIGEDSMGIIIDSLINLYSDPIGSIVREVTSNCYDAHQEKDLKIRKIINLEDDDDPQWFYPSTKKPQIEFQEENILLGVGNAFLFRDFGIGLSKRRVEEIYTLFGNSTKRDNNHQIGGFGIGAKSPFSYTNTFYIITNHNGKKYSYMLYRGNDAFHMDLLKTTNTTELNSTEVIIPIGEEDSYRDIRNFVKAINNQLMYFRDLEYINIDEGTGRVTKKAHVDYEDDNLVIDLSQQHDSDLADIHLIVGRVRYPLSYNQLDKSLTWGSERIPCAIKFEVGELDLVPSREAIRYTDKTKEALKNKILRIQKDLTIECEVELESANNWITWLKQAEALRSNNNSSWRRKFDSIFAVKSYLAKLECSAKDMQCKLHDVELSKGLLKDDYRNNFLFRGFSVYKVRRESNGNYVGGYKLVKNKPEIKDLIKLPIFFQQQVDPDSEETRKIWSKVKDFHLLKQPECEDGFIQIRRSFRLTEKDYGAENELFTNQAARTHDIIDADFAAMSTLMSHVKMIDYDSIDMSNVDEEEDMGMFETEAERRKRLGKAFLRRIYFKDKWGKRDKVSFSNDEYHIHDLEKYVEDDQGIVIWGNSGESDLLKQVAAICEQAGKYPDMCGYGVSSLDVKRHPVIIVKAAATLNKQLTKFINVKDLFKMKHSILVNWNTARITKEETDDIFFFSIFETLNSDLFYKWKELKENHENNYKQFSYLNRVDEDQIAALCKTTDCINHRMMSNLKTLIGYSQDLDLLKHLEFAQNDGKSKKSIPSKKVFLALKEYLRFKNKAVVKFKKQKKKDKVKSLVSV